MEFEVKNPKELLVYMTQEKDEMNQIRFYVPNNIQESFENNIVKIRNKLSGQEIEIDVAFQNYTPFSFINILGYLDFFGIFAYVSGIKFFTTDFLAIILLSGVVLYIAKSYFMNNIEDVSLF